jgi:hypothetical protein
MTTPFDNLRMTPDIGGESSKQETSMPDTAKKAKVATPRQAPAKSAKDAEIAKPTKAARKGIELVAKVEAPKKAKAAAKKPNGKVAKQESAVSISEPKTVSQETIEQVAYQIWVERGFQHGHALEDWIRAERELLGRAT